MVCAKHYISRNIKKCIICNHHEGNPFQYPAPPYLPLYRLNDKFSFTYRAVDYAGPLCINNILVNYKRLNARLFYLPVLPIDVYTQIQFLIVVHHHKFVCQKSFFAGGGVPTLIISDNGSQFVSNEVQSSVNSKGLNGNLIYPVPLSGVICSNR